MRPNPIATGIRLETIDLDVSISIEADLPEAYVREPVLIDLEVGLGPIRREEGDHCEKRAKEQDRTAEAIDERESALFELEYCISTRSRHFSILLFCDLLESNPKSSF